MTPAFKHSKIPKTQVNAYAAVSTVLWDAPYGVLVSGNVK